MGQTQKNDVIETKVRDSCKKESLISCVKF